jgi:hypothetical protein
MSAQVVVYRLGWRKPRGRADKEFLPVASETLAEFADVEDARAYLSQLPTPDRGYGYYVSIGASANDDTF